MRVETIIVCEQISRRRVVHVHRIRIRHVDLDVAERVEAAGILSDGEVRRAVGRPVDRLRTDLLVTRAQYAHVHPAQVARISAHVPDDLVLRNGQRHGPGRIEIDRGDVGGERRRRLVDLADDDAIAPLDLVVGDRFDEGRRDVHDHVAFGKHEIHAEQAFERSFELLDPRGDRHIERAQGLRADAAVRLESVAQLKMLDRVDESRVVAVAGFELGREIVGNHQPLAQQGHLGPARSRRKLGVGRYRRPAAAHLDGGIAEQRFLDSLIGALVEHRIGRERERGRRSGLGGGWRFGGARRLTGRLRRLCSRGRVFCGPRSARRRRAQYRLPDNLGLLGVHRTRNQRHTQTRDEDSLHSQPLSASHGCYSNAVAAFGREVDFGVPIP